MKNSFSWEQFDSMPVVGILRSIPMALTEQVAELYRGAGLSTLEITMNSAGAEETIAALDNTYGDRLNVGAGTVCTLEDLDKALAAGAKFIVTPVFHKKIIKACVENNTPVFPGAYTPSEIYKAWSLGAGMVKVFPATQLGPTYIKDVLAPLNQIKLLPTGGVTLENMIDFLQAGAMGLGMGSSLFPKHLIENELWDALKHHFESVVQKYRQYQEQIKTKANSAAKLA